MYIHTQSFLYVFKRNKIVDGILFRYMTIESHQQCLGGVCIANNKFFQ